MSEPKNQWFDDVFLPSIFEYVQKSVGLRKNCKISRKQFEICIQYMDVVQCYDSTYRKYFTYYRYVWNDREVDVFQKNNCFINFSLNSSENSKNKQEEARIREIEKFAQLKRIKNNPERLEKSLARKMNKLQKLQKELQESIDDGEDDDIIEYIKEDIEKLKFEIDFLTKHEE